MWIMDKGKTNVIINLRFCWKNKGVFFIQNAMVVRRSDVDPDPYIFLDPDWDTINMDPHSWL